MSLMSCWFGQGSLFVLSSLASSSLAQFYSGFKTWSKQSLHCKAFLQVHKEIIISSLYACLVPTHYYSHLIIISSPYACLVPTHYSHLIIIIFLFSSHYSHLFVSIHHIISWVQTWYHAHFCVLRVRAQGLSNNNSRKLIESKGLGGLF